MGHIDPGAAARFARGKVSGDEAAQMRDHLATCDECRQRVELRPQEADAITQSQPNRAHAPQRSSGLHPSHPSAEGLPSTQLDRGTTLGRYLVLNTIGQGGMGVVYAAYDPELDRKVAVKVLRPGRKGAQSAAEGQARLLREAQAMARVSHPNVISVFDVGTLDDRVFVAMEFIDGPTLKSWVRDTPRGWQEILKAFLQAGRGLEAAHTAGMVHRDFKPENVLVGQDGRAYVTDFGLARLVADDATSESADHDSGEDPKRSPSITHESVVIGTPQYMAPEQHLGRPPDARSDQFSFCAALYWALYRRRPFDPDRLTQAAVDADSEPTQPLTPADRQSGSRFNKINVTGRGVIQEPPRDAKVPSWVKKIVLRGLELDPEARFGSMSELLGQLEHDPWIARRRVGVAAAGALAIGMAVAAYQQGRAEQQQLCTGAEQKLASVWTPEVRDRIDRAFLGTGKAFARDASSRVSSLLDDYTAGWAAMHKDACQATRLRGEQTEQVLSLRMICLDRRLEDVTALTSLLQQADAKVVERAVDAASALSPLTRCADIEALTSRASLPDDPKVQAELQAVGAELAKVKTLLDAGRFKEGLELAGPAAARAEAAGYAPLLAEALHLQGWLQDLTGDAKTARTTLERSFRSAEAGRDDVTKVVAATKLVYSTGHSQGALEEAHLWSRLARASLERVGHRDHSLQVDLLSNVGAIHVLEGKYTEALTAFREALSLSESALGKDHPKRAMLLTSVGIAHTREGKFQEAKGALEESLALIQRIKGANHPSTAYPHYNLSDLLRRLGDFKGAYFHVQKALSIWEAALGPDHPTVGSVTDGLASILQAQDRFVEAVDEFRRALEIKEKALGPEHPDLSYSLEGIGTCLLELSRAKDAVPNLERALALRGDSGGAEELRFQLARALWLSGRDRERARVLANQAKEAFTQSGQQEDAKRVRDWMASSEVR